MDLGVTEYSHDATSMFPSLSTSQAGEHARRKSTREAEDCLKANTESALRYHFPVPTS
jgi:hypothetical protein